MRLFLCSFILLSSPTLSFSLPQTAAARVASRTARDSLQAILLTMIFAAAETIKSKGAQAQASANLNHLPPAAILKWAREGVEQVSNSPAIWISILSAPAQTYMLAEPTRQVLGRAVAWVTSNAQFRSFFEASVMAYVMSGGWQLSQQLWREAQAQLQNVDDIRRTENAWPLLEPFLTKIENRSEDQRQRADLAHTMLSNIYRIFFIESELRRQWLSHTWRMNIANGEFILSGIGLLTTILLVTRYSPTIGPMGGIAIGVAGGAATVLTPKWLHHALSQAVVSLREEAARLAYRACLDSFENPMQAKYLHHCRPARQRLGLLYVDALYRIHQSVTDASQMFNHAVYGWNIAEAEKHHQRLKDLAEEKDKTLNQLRQMYLDQKLAIDRRREKASTAFPLQDGDCESSRLQALEQNISRWADLIEDQWKQNQRLMVQTVRDRISLRHFSEREVLNKLNIHLANSCERITL